MSLQDVTRQDSEGKNYKVVSQPIVAPHMIHPGCVLRCAVPCCALLCPAVPCSCQVPELRGDREDACFELLTLLFKLVCPRPVILDNHLSSTQQAVFLCVVSSEPWQWQTGFHSRLCGCTLAHVQAVTSHSANVEMAPICFAPVCHCQEAMAPAGAA